jgi:hypothetical protein
VIDRHAEKLLAVAFSYETLHEEGKDNYGQLIKRFLQRVGLPEGYPWCAAFIAHCGYYSCYDFTSDKSLWPLPLTGGCRELGRFASAKGVLSTTPQPGDLFLIYYPSLGRFGHVGLLISKNADGSWNTLEGNTNDGDPNSPEAREGWGIYRRKGKGARHFKDTDRFVRWSALLQTPETHG